MKLYLAIDPGELTIPINTGWLLSNCMEWRVRQYLLLETRPLVLGALEEQATLQSAASACRLERVTVDKKRLRPLLLEGAQPEDPSEAQLVGYRDALDWVHTEQAQLPITPGTIRELHRMIVPGVEDQTGPVGALALERLCLQYLRVTGEDRLPPLLAAASFVLDFFFTDVSPACKVRLAWLLTLVLLHHLGFQATRYISIERIIEEKVERLNETLAATAEGWHEGKLAPVPWWDYFLTVINHTFDELEERLESAGSNLGKTELIRHTVTRLPEPFTLAEVAARCPSVSIQLIKKVLSHMKKEGLLELRGRARGARWRVLRPEG